MRTLLPCLTLLALFCVGAGAKEAQSLSATVDGLRFTGDDHTILLVPLPSGEFSLQAATAGAASYPPPATPVDRLSIMCRGYAPGKPMKLGSKDFATSACNATFTRAAREAGKEAEEYSLDKRNPDTLFEVTAAHDKVSEGRFEFHMSNKAGKALIVSGGAFVVEDRQL